MFKDMGLSDWLGLGTAALGTGLGLLASQKASRERKRQYEALERQRAIAERQLELRNRMADLQTQAAMAPLDVMQFYTPMTQAAQRSYRDALAAEFAAQGKPLDSTFFTLATADYLTQKELENLARAQALALQARATQLAGMGTQFYPNVSTGEAAGLYASLPTTPFSYESLMALPNWALARSLKKGLKPPTPPESGASTPIRYDPSPVSPDNPNYTRRYWDIPPVGVLGIGEQFYGPDAYGLPEEEPYVPH